MSGEYDSSSYAQEFKGWRGIFWPIHNFELKKFLPMSIMMICMLFNYTLLRDTKDTLIIHAPLGGAECLSFLKLYGVTPSAILFMLVFFKIVNVVKQENLFYLLLFSFLSFFGAFAFIIYPNIETLHMSVSTMNSLQAQFPHLHWFIPILGNWSFSLFYILSELWGSVMLSMLFWQFANQITKVHEAKRFYSLFGMIGNIGLLLSGPLLIWSARNAQSIHLDDHHAYAFGTNLKFLMSAILIAGFIIAFNYRWMNKNVLTDPRLYTPEQKVQKKDKVKLSFVESVKYIFNNKYLLLIAVLVICYGVSINLVEGVWKGQIKIAFPDMNDYNAFMGQFSTWTGGITIVFMLVGNNILRRVTWLTAAIITPLIILTTSAIFFAVVWHSTGIAPFTPFMGTTIVMLAVIVGQVQNVFSKGSKYSLFDPTKNMTYIPLDRESKTKGQAAVEVIGGRAGKSGGAAIQSTLLAVISGNVTLASLTYILGPLVILTCVIWIFSVVALSKRFTHVLNTPKEEATIPPTPTIEVSGKIETVPS